MTEKRQIYRCGVCGNITEVLHSGQGELICCGQPMNLQKEQSEGEYAEKHAPVIQRAEDGSYKIKVGKVTHPMTEDHYIEWIEFETDKGFGKIFLKPGDAPEANCSVKSEKIKARMYCNLHGLWKNKGDQN